MRKIFVFYLCFYDEILTLDSFNKPRNMNHVVLKLRARMYSVLIFTH